jgi:hypothetical protein
MKYFFLLKQLIYGFIKFLHVRFLKFPIATEAWNPAIRAGAGSSSCDQKGQNSLTLNYSLNHILYARLFHLLDRANEKKIKF